MVVNKVLISIKLIISLIMLLIDLFSKVVMLKVVSGEYVIEWYLLVRFSNLIFFSDGV